jgi:hypothetical protein
MKPSVIPPELLQSIAEMGERYGDAARDLAGMIGDDAAHAFIKGELFGTTVKLDDGREIPRSAIAPRGSDEFQ